MWSAGDDILTDPTLAHGDDILTDQTLVHGDEKLTDPTLAHGDKILKDPTLGHGDGTIISILLLCPAPLLSLREAAFNSILSFIN